LVSSILEQLAGDGPESGVARVDQLVLPYLVPGQGAGAIGQV
jgi:hypothetical protein